MTRTKLAFVVMTAVTIQGAHAIPFDTAGALKQSTALEDFIRKAHYCHTYCTHRGARPTPKTPWHFNLSCDNPSNSLCYLCRGGWPGSGLGKWPRPWPYC